MDPRPDVRQNKKRVKKSVVFFTLICFIEFMGDHQIIFDEDK